MKSVTVRKRAATGLVGSVLVCVIGLPSTSFAQAVPSTAPRPGDLAVLGGQLFDGVADEARANPGILIRNGTIVGFGVDAAAARAGGATVLPVGASQTILPGFIDLHAHYAIDLFGEGRVDEYEVNPVIFLANGVTSTFPGGAVDPEGMWQARLEIERGERPGTRMLGSGPYFGTARPGWQSDLMTPDSIRAEVDLWASRGASGFKAKGIRRDQLAALIDAAHRHGLTVTGHLDSGIRTSANPQDAVLMGIDRIEHFMGGNALPDFRSAYASLEALDFSDNSTRRSIEETYALYIAHGTNFDATMSAYGYFTDYRTLDPEVFEKWTDEQRFLTPYARGVANERIAQRRPSAQFGRIYMVKRGTLKGFYDAGGEGLITLGTDHPSWGEFLSGFSVHREMHAMVKAGLPEAGVLKIATINGARAIGLGHQLGSVELGKVADLVVVAGDPLTDITATRNTVLVIKAGDVYSPRALLQSVEGKLGPGAEWQSGWWKGNVRLGR